MFPDYNAVRNYLYQLSLNSQRRKYGIDRMILLAGALGQPQQKFPIIHVAGTNGKGSTCVMLEAIYRQAGYKTGLYTSPHLIFIGERIQVNRQPLTVSQLTAYTEETKVIGEQLAQNDPEDHPSFFEFMTAIAFQHFHREQVDIALVETGLGGRLDATNVVEPELAVITSIAFDHTHLLGNTLSQIAREKAGIIKPNKPVVCGILPAEADATIQAIAQERHAPIHRVVDAFGPNLVDYPATNLAGSHQRRNAASATLAVKVLQEKFFVPETAIHDALKKIDWPGRWQTHSLAQGKTLILDASHNCESFAGLVENLESLINQTGRKPIILAAALGEDRARALMTSITPYTDTIVLLCPKQPRACSSDRLQAALPQDFTGTVCQSDIPTLFPQPRLCTLGEPHSTLVATGSIYLLGEIMEALRGPSRSGAEHHLQDRL